MSIDFSVYFQPITWGWIAESAEATKSLKIFGKCNRVNEEQGCIIVPPERREYIPHGIVSISDRTALSDEEKSGFPLGYVLIVDSSGLDLVFELNLWIDADIFNFLLKNVNNTISSPSSIEVNVRGLTVGVNPRDRVWPSKVNTAVKVNSVSMYKSREIVAQSRAL